MRLEQGGYSLQPASLVFHELSFGIQRLADGRRKVRFRSYLQNLLSSSLPVLMDRSPRLLQPGVRSPSAN